MAEDAPKTVVILTGDAKKVAPVVQFLNNRGWDTHWSGNLREGLELILKIQPAYILLSVEFPHPKVRTLPKILSQHVLSEVIPFAETQSTTTYNLIQTLNARYSVIPPASGPAVERTLLRIQRDVEEKSKMQETSAAEALNASPVSKEQSDFITVSGGSPEASIVVQGGGGAKGSQYVSGSTTEPSENAQTSGSSQAKNVAPRFIQVAENPSLSAKQSAAGSAIVPSPSRSQDSKPHQGVLPGPNQNDKSPSLLTSSPSKTSGATAGPVQPTPPSSRAQGAPSKKASAPVPPSTEAGQAQNSSKPPKDPLKASEDETPQKKAEAQAEAYWDPDLSKPKTPKVLSVPTKAGAPEDTILNLGTEVALNDSCDGEGASDDSASSVTVASNVICIVVESTRFSGYLIAALGEDRVFDEKFVEAIKARLTQFLKDQGEQLEDEESLHLKIKEVAFEDWAIEYADFLKKSIHHGEEVAMAFFPRTDAMIELEESDHEHMLSLDLKKVDPEVPLEFDAYIYMPVNEKFLLYTGRNRTLMTHQKDRLESRGITHLYIHKDDVEGVKKFWAQNYLNSKIDEFAANQPAAKPRKKSA